MPEGDTLFRAATALRKALEGARVARFTSDKVRGDLEGQRIDEVRAEGKNLLIRFERGRVLRTHLRMTGSWHLYREGEPWQRPAWQARVAIHADNGMVAVCFNAPVVEWLREPLQLGPDATTDAFDAAEALRRVRAYPDRTLAEVLLTQRALAGVGNVIKSETLFRCRMDPFLRVAQAPDEALARLISEAHRVLLRNRVAGPRTTRESLDGGRHWVYGRSGKPCRVCGTTIEMKRFGVGLRSTYFCPHCQCGVAPLGERAPEE